MSHRLPHEMIEGDVDMEVAHAIQNLERALDRLDSLVTDAADRVEGDPAWKSVAHEMRQAVTEARAAVKDLNETVKDLIE